MMGYKRSPKRGFFASLPEGRHPELTGLEPATSAVTGRRSNQLSYNSSEKVVTLELNLGGFNRKFLRIERWVQTGKARRAWFAYARRAVI